jgi:inhibitor of cysteine peptidase
MFKVKRSMIVVMVIILLGISFFGIFQRDTGQKVFNEKDSSSVIDIKVGDSFVVELEENLSTGYTWHCTIVHEEIVDLESDEYMEPDKTDNMVGVPGTHQYKFIALNNGSTQIKFEYYRDWEPENIAENYVFNVSVR